MTVLGKPDVVRSIERGEIGASRGKGRKLAVEPASMDVHLSSKLKHPRCSETVKVDEAETYPEYDSVDTDRPYVPEGSFILATTQEKIHVPKDKVALLHGRSSVGRLGLFVENAGLIDPGFEGQVTLELFNAASHDTELVSGMRIAQITFHDVKTAPDVGYSEYNGNKYDGQIGPTTSRLYEDFE